MKRLALLLLLACCLPGMIALGQRSKKKAQKETKPEKHYLESVSLSGLKFRNIGPSITSGRISDFAVNPNNPSEYYIATSSGGVWKTINYGTTFSPIFDGQKSYSIGCITMDPQNPNVLWVGSGENNSQRSVSYGDGVYRSNDGGKSWKNMGLKTSEHIGNIIVHPENSDIVYVSAIGPLWKEGGERGVYKTTDGGKTWEAVLTISEHTGVDNIIMDPRDPDVLYAAAYQRRRHVFTYLGGGPESGIYKTTDGGKSWEKANKGLPGVDKGRIGLAISPANPEKLYAIVEAAQGKSGFYRSTNRGASWEKRSSFSTIGLYYQEIFCDPKDPDKIFAMDTWLSASTDGGKSFKPVGEVTKHVDNHCIWIDPQNTNHWLVGCDGGIYETWDHAKTWDFKENLPITQFYKVSVDNSEPFYYVYGGTQDNFSLGGPSRVNTSHGITNSDWFITHGGDGFESEADPDNPNIVYAQSQYGVLVRYDRSNGEEVGIQPKPGKGEDNFRWNWDAPLQVSAHKSGRLYFSANKVFRSDDRGNSWTTISDDLTAQINRNELKVMGRVWGFEAVSKNASTSPYGTIVAFSESPKDENLLYVGTDDGLIQITENGGENWRRVSGISGAPNQSYVNDLIASRHDENVVYAAFNHHKYGDFKPYVFKSADKGNTWTAITNNLPEKGSVYALEEDPVDPNLLFCGTEFGVFFSNNGGKNWKQLKAGLPPIAVRDIAIQERENDLVLATFGRGFYVLDDYSSLRNVSKENMEKEAMLFASRPGLSYEEASPLGLPGKAFQGDTYYGAENLGPTVIFTYYLKDKISDLQSKRREAEKKARKDGGDVAYPSYESLKAEQDEIKPQLLFTIKDAAGDLVREITKSPSKGVQRLKWDLRYAATSPVSLTRSSFYNPFAGQRKGTLVEPGTFTVSLSKIVNGQATQIAGPLSFDVKALNNATLPAADKAAKTTFQREVAELSRRIQGVQRQVSEMNNELRYMKAAAKESRLSMTELMDKIYSAENKLKAVQMSLFGDRLKSRLDMSTKPSVMSRIGSLQYEQSSSTAAPTQTHRDVYSIAKEEFEPVLKQVKDLAENVMPALQTALEDAGAPYTPGRKIGKE